MQAVPVPIVLGCDRSIAVPAGMVVRTGYVDVFRVRLACRDRMSIGDVERAYQKRLQMGDRQAWPCPTGRWDGEQFELFDGRHEWLATVMLGHSHMLVAWLENT